jgi:hypothetical protein
MNNMPQELDWVTVRAACSVEQVFKELHQGVKDDVEAMNLLCEQREEAPIAMSTHRAGNAFFVGRGQAIKPVVRFLLGKDRIEIADEVSNQTFVVTLTLNNEGRCKLRIEQEEFEQWQVRRMSLEKLFFGPV